MGDGLKNRQPNGPPDDLGGTEAAFYFVEDGALTMCEENGKPLAKPYPLTLCTPPR